VSTHGLNTQRMSAVQKVWSSYVYATILLQHGPTAKSAFSNSWTKGILHRDFLDERTSRVHTFMIFIDEVNQANGSVEIWTNSQSLLVRLTEGLRLLTNGLVKRETGL
jgi:hypothetical protein